MVLLNNVFVDFRNMKYILLYFLLFVLSSCHKTVIGRVTEVIYTPWRSGTIIQYKICFNKIEGKGLDSTYLIGNRIYIKDTYNPFYFEIGDSLKIKLGLTQYQNKFISIYKLVDREEKTTKKEHKNTKWCPIFDIDTPPLLPGSQTNKDNKLSINKFISKKAKEENVKIKNPFLIYLDIDTLGRAYIHSMHSQDTLISQWIEQKISELPAFSPPQDNGEKVNVMASYRIICSNSQ